MQQQLALDIWQAWAAGQITDGEAQAAAETHHARNRAGAGGRPVRPQNAPRAISESRRGVRRDKVFGHGRYVPLDRNAKVRVMTLARALMRRTEPGRAYGAVTAKALAVLNALLWGFHNAASGKCFPSYEAIAERAGCARSTVAEAIRALERAGILTWANRIKRVREYVPGLFGKASAWRWRVVRTSNGYVFSDPASKSDFQTRTPAQDSTEERIASNMPPARAVTRHTVVGEPIRSINSIKTNGEEPNRGRL